MITSVIMPDEPVIENAIKKFDITDTAIEEMRQNYLPLKIAGIEDKKGLKAVYEARQIVKSKRILVERKRKELNVSAQDYIKGVNGEAKRITDLLTPIEDHLEQEETRIDNERERLQREAIQREQQRIQERIDKLSAYGYAVDYASLKSITEIEFNDVLEQARVAHEKEQELDKLRKEQQEREQALIYEQNIIAAEKKAIELQKQKEADAYKAKLQAIEERKRVASLKPDREKLSAFEGELSCIVFPECNDKKAIAIIEEAKARIENVKTFILQQVESFSVLIANYDSEVSATIVK